ncbi:hypothetical protein F4823DRAFT_104710 [Ustulina deusta]|nr:hypothetical protein F4823DRAFT_104710 [Ustulina deusta]
MLGSSCRVVRAWCWRGDLVTVSNYRTGFSYTTSNSTRLVNMLPIDAGRRSLVCPVAQPHLRRSLYPSPSVPNTPETGYTDIPFRPKSKRLVYFGLLVAFIQTIGPNAFSTPARYVVLFLFAHNCLSCGLFFLGRPGYLGNPPGHNERMTPQRTIARPYPSWRHPISVVGDDADPCRWGTLVGRCGDDRTQSGTCLAASAVTSKLLPAPSAVKIRCDERHRPGPGLAARTVCVTHAAMTFPRETRRRRSS